VRIIGIIWADAVQYKIETVGKVGDAGPKAIEIKAIFNVRAFNFTKHFVPLETAEPLKCIVETRREHSSKEGVNKSRNRAQVGGDVR